MKQADYVRLPGRRSGLLRRETLWLGSDHLLLVRSTRFNEDYRRFYLADIEALVVQHRPPGARRTVDNLALGVTVLATAALLATHHPVWGTLLGLVVLVYGWISLRRQDCKTWIQTAVGTSELSPLCRIGSARRALALLDGKIRAAQPATPEAELVSALETPPPLPFVSVPAPPPLPATVEATRPPSPLYLGAFIWLGVLGLFRVYAACSTGVKLPWVLPCGCVVFVAIAIIPLVRHGISNIRGARAAAILSSLVVVGSIGTYALNWATSGAARRGQAVEAQKIRDWIDNSTALHISVAVVLLLLAIWGLLAFLTASAIPGERAGGPVTLFGSERS
ncbi:MAG TPA: hypothetical protein VMJ34_10315 [Bryobacteraceae bacterium]|nr:hypothetical protein [Bryobacteraceae bacterium]